MDAPHRVLVNTTVRKWIEAGRPSNGAWPGEGEGVATTADGRKVLRYDSDTAELHMKGDIEALPLWAEQGVSLVHRISPASEIVAEIFAGAKAALESAAATHGILTDRDLAPTQPGLPENQHRKR